MQNQLDKEQQPVETSNIESQATTKGGGSWKHTLSLFKVSKDYFYTPIIIYLNVGIWLMMVFTGVDPVEPSVDSLVEWGGNLSFLTLDGQPWRLLTSTFLHGGILHLVLNMYALLQVGAILEIHFGKHRYALVYLVTGIFASIASAAFGGNIVSVGASGAIFGLYGLFVSLLITKSLKISAEETKAMLTSTLTFIVYNVIYGFAKAGIDNAAHIGGLVSGFVVGMAYYRVIAQEKKSMIVSTALIAITSIAVIVAPSVITNPFMKYNEIIEPFSTREEAAMWMYSEPLPTPGSEEAKQFSAKLKTQGIDLWNENLELLGSLSDLPTELQERVDLLKTYCQLRIQACEALQLLLDNNDETQLNRVQDINGQIDELLGRMGGE